MNKIKLIDLTIDHKGHYGIGASACDFQEGFPLYLRITDIDDNSYVSSLPTCINPTDYPDYNNYFLKNNDIVFARTGNSTGRNYFYDGKEKNVVFAGFLIKFSLNPLLVVPKYVSYYCQTKQYKDTIDGLSNGSTRKNLNANQFGELEIPMCSMIQQQHIVNTIGSLDDLIEKYEEILKKISNLKTLYYNKSIVNAKKLSTLLDFINIETGSMNLNENNPNGKYIFYTRNEGIFKADKYTHEQEGVIVAGEGNFTPKYANGKFGLHQRAYLIYSNNNLFSNKVLFQIINANVNYLNGIAVGSTVKSLRKNSFENMPFYFDGNYRIIEDKLKEIHTLEEQYKELLNEIKNLKKQYLGKFFK